MRGHLRVERVGEAVYWLDNQGVLEVFHNQAEVVKASGMSERPSPRLAWTRRGGTSANGAADATEREEKTKGD